MLHLTYSNRTEALLDALSRDLTAWRESGASPFTPARLVVPNKNVEQWLKHQLARHDGIAANLEVLQLRRFVAELLAGRGLHLVDAGVLEDLLLSLLLDEAWLSRPALDRVRAWLRGAGDSPDALDLRRVQLARVLSQLFEEYGYSREGLLASWPRGPQLGETALGAIEAWERRMWLDARALLERRVGGSVGPSTSRPADAPLGTNGRAHARNSSAGATSLQLELTGLGAGGKPDAEPPAERWLQLSETLPELAPSKLSDTRPVFFFGVSYVARLFHKILGRLAQGIDLHVYTLNPCAEFWDDIPAGWELRKLPNRGGKLGEGALDEPDPFGLSEAQGHPLLQLWGRPGRENIRLLNELASCDFRGAFVDPFAEKPSLLRLLQRDILQNDPQPRLPASSPVTAEQLAADRSVRVLACPGVRREAEVIAGEIWSLIRDDEKRSGGEPLRFNDIAVLVAGSDPEAWFTQLGAVFQETGNIPFSVSDSSFVAESRVAEAVSMLLELPFGRFGRTDLLRLVTHPSVAGRFGEVDPEEWIGWCEAVGIVHGADHSDHAGTYIDRDILNWDQGLRRLALGAAMTGARSGDDRMLRVGERDYLPEELGQSGATSAAHFGLLARSLIADAKHARDARLEPEEWASLLGTMVETYVAPRNDLEEHERARCLKAVRSLADRDFDGKEVSYRVAYELASEALEEIPGGQGQYLARGVVLSTLQPMRAIPFRVIFIAGLGEGRFPAQDRRNQLDLRQAKPQAGDVSPRERDEYMFLETVLCARDRLYLSYLSRNELTGDRLEPAPVVTDLLRAVEPYLPPRAREARSPLIETHALRRFDARYFPTLFGKDGCDFPAAPGARLEAKALALRAQIDRTISTAQSSSALPLPQTPSSAHGAERGLSSCSCSGPCPGPGPVVAGARIVDLEALRDALSDRGREMLDSQLGLPHQSIGSARVFPERLRLPLSKIRGFLDCPLQTSASVLLGLYSDDEEDLLDREDERFEMPFLESLGFLRERFVEKLSRDAHGTPASFADLHDERAEREVLCGRMPAGVFGDVERGEHLQQLEAWRQVLAQASEESPALERVRIGPADEHARTDVVADPIVLTFEPGEIEGLGQRLEVEIGGSLEPQLFGRRSSLALSKRKPASVKNEWERLKLQRLAIRGFVDAVALAASGLGEGPHELLSLISDGDSAVLGRVGFQAIGHDEALAWLRETVRELLSGVHGYLMPAEATIRFHDSESDPEPVSFAEQVEAVSEGLTSTGSSFGPVRHPECFPPPDDDSARQIIEERWGLFFERRETVDLQKVELEEPDAAPPPPPASKAPAPKAPEPEKAKRRGQASKSAATTEEKPTSTRRASTSHLRNGPAADSPAPAPRSRARAKKGAKE